MDGPLTPARQGQKDEELSWRLVVPLVVVAIILLIFFWRIKKNQAALGKFDSLKS
jgi:nitrogen fixation-related uncharacterized protein